MRCFWVKKWIFRTVLRILLGKLPFVPYQNMSFFPSTFHVLHILLFGGKWSFWWKMSDDDKAKKRKKKKEKNVIVESQKNQLLTREIGSIRLEI